MNKIVFIHIPKPAKTTKLSLSHFARRTRMSYPKHINIEIHFFESTQTDMEVIDGIEFVSHSWCGRGQNIFGDIDYYYHWCKTINEILKSDNVLFVSNVFDHLTFPLIGFMSKIKKTKSVLRLVGRGNISIYNFPKWLTRYTLESVAFTLASRILCISNELSNRFGKRYIAGNKTMIIHQGIDINFFVPRDDDLIQRPLRKAIFVGRLVENKGLDDAISVINSYNSKNPNKRIILYICGGGENEEKYRYLTSYLKHIVMLGGVTQNALRKLYSSSDLLVFPSYNEGAIPNAVLEAAASRLLVVSSNVSSIGRIFTELDIPTFSPGNTSEFENIINSYSNNISSRLEHINKLYKHVEDNYGINITCERYSRFIEDIK